jgi:hypothetical protein
LLAVMLMRRIVTKASRVRTLTALDKASLGKLDVTLMRQPRASGADDTEISRPGGT